jgi:hypothetical protein
MLGHESIAAAVQGRRHHPPEGIVLRATNQIHAGKGGVQSAGVDSVIKSVPANARGTELLQMYMTVLELGEPRDFGIARPPDRLK